MTIREQVVKRQKFILSPEIESVRRLVRAFLWICAGGVHGGRSEAPRRKSHRPASARGRRQYRLDTTEPRNCGNSAGARAFGGNDHHRIAFLKISEWSGWDGDEGFLVM